MPYLLSIDDAIFFLSDKINQDPLEEHFGRIRMRGGGSQNPLIVGSALRIRSALGFPWKYSWRNAR